ncbi:MAG: MarR family transcriptional regulator [Clostridiales bacterium]|nr:MarR family transcriptional regulator [Clostridiales bacterium]
MEDETQERRKHCGELLKNIQDSLQRDANNHLKNDDITFAQMKLLLILYEHTGGEATMKELEKHLQVAQSTTAGIAARLEKKKLIEGYADPHDKRIKHVRITSAGKDICFRTRESVDNTERRLLEALTPEEREEFHRLLVKISCFIQ